MSLERTALIFGLLGLMLTASGCRKGGDPAVEASPAETKVFVEVREVTSSRLEDWLGLPGRIEPYREVTVSAEVGGILEWRVGDEGTRVSAGEKIAVIDGERYELQERRAELALDQARIAVERADTGIESAEVAASTTMAVVGQAEALLAQAREQERKARAMRDERARDMERGKALIGEELISRVRLDEIEMALETAEADLASAEEGIKAATAGLEVALAGRKGGDASLKAARHESAAARSRVRAAEADLELTRLQLRKSTVLSPIDGVVDHAFSETGEFVKGQDPLFRVVQLEPVLAVFHLPEKDVPYMEEGRHAKVLVKALSPTPFVGKVSKIGVSSDRATSTYRLEVEMPNEGGKLRPGMLARLSLLREEFDEAVSVPIFSVLNADGGDAVFLYDNGVARRRPVETGIVEGERIQIRRGLVPGDQLIVKGQRDLEDGQKVALQ